MIVGGYSVPYDEHRTQLDRLGPTVVIEKNVANLVTHYQASDLAILLSDGEGLSNFLLEAMSCGLPTMTSQSAAIAGIHSGIVLPASGKLSEYCLQQLLRLQDDRQELLTRGTKIRQEMQNAYSLSVVTDQYERLYRDMLPSAGHAASVA